MYHFTTKLLPHHHIVSFLSPLCISGTRVFNVTSHHGSLTLIDFLLKLRTKPPNLKINYWCLRKVLLELNEMSSISCGQACKRKSVMRTNLSSLTLCTILHQGNSQQCPGEGTESKSCQLRACPAGPAGPSFGPWTQWGDCTATCWTQGSRRPQQYRVRYKRNIGCYEQKVLALHGLLVLTLQCTVIILLT